MIDEVLGAGFSADAGELKAGLKEIVGELIARKQSLFPDNTRKIISFELTDAGSSFHLTVASTL